MNWFDEQIRLRKDKDQEIFEDSIFGMASAVMGQQGARALNDERIITKAAIDEVLKYYHCKPIDIPDSLKTPEDQLDYALRPHGIMYRSVTLSEKWYRRSFSPMIAYRAEDGLPVVLLPGKFGGYTWYDKNGNKVKANKRTAGLLLPDAICFYSSLPLRKIGISGLLGYMKSCLNWSDVAILIGLTLMVTLTGMMLPLITKMLSGFVLESGSGLVLLSAAIFMLCVLVSSQFFTVSRELAMSRIQIKVGAPMEAAMTARLMNLPTSFFRQFSAGELASRTWAINGLSSLLLGGVVSTGMTAIASLLYITQIFNYAPSLGLPALVISLASIAVTLLIGFLKMKQQREYMKASADESGVSFSIISGVQKIKLSGAEKRAFAKWAKTYSSGAEIEYNPSLILKISPAILLAISLIGNVWFYFSAASSGVSPSAYLAFTAAFGTVTGAITAFSNIAAYAAQIKPILEMAEPILQTEPETAENKQIVTKLSGNIELSNIYFRYRPTAPYVLNGLDLKIRAGEYVAIVGKTGCGKSTLMRMLLGFETPEKGTVYFDRKDIRSLDLRSLRRKMGVVTQDGSLFSGDIYSNITVSAPQLTLDDAWEAAELAGVADDIRAMPMGMHTFVSEGQGGISGGQKQRLMIARAIAPKPKILLFDEATSALDNKTQKQVSDALAGLKCTRIVIAHRLSTVRHCDRILVLDGGRIAESGNYDELIARGGIFAELVERQRVDV
ncbi:MAG: NHLP bacteriocin export ABC transporter permease/ATPase subunit [Clostridia bacterium]|nr:NHLP bacteriocin export ABC transporter permease/ATPase subunit [Clostridia bacterium]